MERQDRPTRRQQVVAVLVFAMTGALFLVHFRLPAIQLAPWVATLVVVLSIRVALKSLAWGQDHVPFAVAIWGMFAMQFLVLFAMLYRNYGILHGDNRIDDPGICLYFSIVTWTTLGYGDYQPAPGNSQLFAALEALLGYVFMALVIAVVASNLHYWRPRKVSSK